MGSPLVGEHGAGEPRAQVEEVDAAPARLGDDVVHLLHRQDLAPDHGGDLGRLGGRSHGRLVERHQAHQAREVVADPVVEFATERSLSNQRLLAVGERVAEGFAVAVRVGGVEARPDEAQQVALGVTSRHAVQVHPAVFTVDAAEAHLELELIGARHRLTESLGGQFPVVGMDRIQPAKPERRLARSEEGRRRRVEELEVKARVGHEDHRGRRLGQQPESLLGGLQFGRSLGDPLLQRRGERLEGLLCVELRRFGPVQPPSADPHARRQQQHARGREQGRAQAVVHQVAILGVQAHPADRRNHHRRGQHHPPQHVAARHAAGHFRGQPRLPLATQGRQPERKDADGRGEGHVHVLREPEEQVRAVGVTDDRDVADGGRHQGRAL